MLLKYNSITHSSTDGMKLFINHVRQNRFTYILLYKAAVFFPPNWNRSCVGRYNIAALCTFFNAGNNQKEKKTQEYVPFSGMHVVLKMILHVTILKSHFCIKEIFVIHYMLTLTLRS